LVAAALAAEVVDSAAAEVALAEEVRAHSHVN
jgi:hypothetical protein